MLYFVLLNVFLKIKDVQLSTYQGVDSMGQISISDLPKYILTCFKNFAKYTYKNVWDVSPTSVVRACIVVAYAASILLGAYLLVVNKRKWYTFALAGVLAVMFPIAVNSIYIMCANSQIGALMVYSASLIFFLPVLFLDMIIKQGNIKIKSIMKLVYNVVVVALLLASINYAWCANGNYTKMYYSNEQTASYFNTMITRIKSCEGFDDENPVYFAGKNITDKQYYNRWAPIEEFDFQRNASYTINDYARDRWMSNYHGFVIKKPSEKQIEEILSSAEFENMNCYPDDNSIKVINGVTVIKLENVLNED